jgi:hypothetical protein
VRPCAGAARPAPDSLQKAGLTGGLPRLGKRPCGALAAQRISMIDLASWLGVPRAFGVAYLPSAILILPKPVSRSPPKTSSIYPSSISRALCSAGMRCIKPLAPSRNETNSSRVNAGADKTWAIARLCAYGWPVQASHPATIKPTHYLDDEGLASSAQKKRPQPGLS